MDRLTDRLPAGDRARLHPDFLLNETSYWQIRESLLPQYRGKWVAVGERKVLTASDDIFEVLDRVAGVEGHPYIARVGFEDQPFVIRRTFPYDRAYRPIPLPRVTARFSGQRADRGVTFDDVIPDTGADLSLLPVRDGDAIGLQDSPYFTSTVRGIIGPPATALVYRGTVEIAGHVCRSLIQLTNVPERILGRDVLNQLRITFDGPAGHVEIS